MIHRNKDDSCVAMAVKETNLIAFLVQMQTHEDEDV